MKSEFPNTRLSVIQRIRDGDDDDRKAALQSFVDSYRPALVAFLVQCKRVPESDAEDYVHDFILNKIMNGRVLELANGKGRFRNLLRVALQRFLIDGIRKKNRERIDSAQSVEEARLLSGEEPDLIDQVWATAVFRSALSVLKAECEYWELFVDRVLTHPPVPYDQIIARHKLNSPEQASNCMTTAKRQFNRIVTNCIREQSYWAEQDDNQELQLELGYLKGLLAKPLLMQQVISGLNETRAVTSLNVEHSLHGDELVLMDETAESLWDNSELPSIFEHLLKQPIADFIESDNGSVSISELLFQANGKSHVALDDLRVLKELFNKRGKTRRSELPDRVDVSMTFALISGFICRGGSISDITSMRPDLLAKRIEKLIEKKWLPPSLAELFRQTVRRILE